MDGDISYESDISESWSLIDVNLNEEIALSTEALSLVESEENSFSNVQNIKLKKSSSLMLQRNENEAQSDNTSDSDSHSGIEGQKCDFVEENLISENSINLRDERKNDSGDAESIEILDIDESDRDAEDDRLNVSFLESEYDDMEHSDDEESVYRVHSENVKNPSMAVIKRKRRKRNNLSESSKDSLNNELVPSSKKYYLKVSPYNEMNGNEDLQLEPFGSSRQAVYKHYRNNVANAMLSLSVGVIFAGVACIAIGHFLGVHDVEETAGELMETLKKLQMENVALQSRLTHIDKAFHMPETSTKFDQKPNDVEGKVCSNRNPALEKEEGKVSDMPESGVRSDSNSIKRSSKVENSIQEQKIVNNENVPDLNRAVNYIHDHLSSVRKGKKDARFTRHLRHLEDSNAKISKVLKGIIAKLSSSHDNLEHFYGKLVALKKNMNKKMNEILPIYPEERCRRGRRYLRHVRTKSLPVIERDLHSIQWNPKSKSKVKDSKVEQTKLNNNSALMYKFPQPEEYYISCKNISRNNENQSVNIYNKYVQVINSSEASNKSIFHSKEKDDVQCARVKAGREGKLGVKKGKQNEEKVKKEKRNDKNKRKESDDKKDKKWKSKKQKVTKGNNRWKSSTNEMKAKNIRNKQKEEKGERKQKQTKHSLKKNRQFSNFTNYETKKYAKVEKENLSKVRLREKFKNSKLQKASSRFSKYSKRSKKDKKNVRVPVGPTLGSKKDDIRGWNQTGYWIFKWADGREEVRKQESLGDWQFKRAKGRKEMRSDDVSLNWQFKRALARESDRWYQDKSKSQNWNDDGFYHKDYLWI